MFKVKDRNYYIGEKLVKEVFEDKGKYFVRLKSEEVQEIDKMTYLNLGGKLWVMNSTC